MFYRLLSWKNPRATGISFAAAVLFIFAARYLNVVRYIIKLTWIVLGITAAAEVAGQAALGKGLTSQFRPRQYFTIPKASLERLLDDVEQLINFFVIESQRIVFAENVYVTIAAFFASLISYFLIKVSTSSRVHELSLTARPVRSHVGSCPYCYRHRLHRPARLHPEQGGH
jgi:hypothetical protein